MLAIVLGIIALVLIGVAHYFMFLSKSWRYLFIFTTFILALVIIYIVFFISESLRYLYDNEQYEKLDTELAIINHKNMGVDPEN